MLDFPASLHSVTHHARGLAHGAKLPLWGYRGFGHAMSPAFLFLLALGLGLAGWLAGRAKARAFTRGAEPRRVVARPGYHAWFVAIWVAIPLGLFAVLWSVLSPILVEQWVLASPAGQDLPAFGFQRQSMLAEARAVASGVPGHMLVGTVQGYRQRVGPISVVAGVCEGVVAAADLFCCLPKASPFNLKRLNDRIPGTVSRSNGFVLSRYTTTSSQHINRRGRRGYST